MIVLVGELNPYGSDPRYALYDEPANSAGGRLRRKILGMRRRDYLAIPRYNLCVGRWSIVAAREKAIEIDLHHAEDSIVLLGRRVGSAFGFSPIVPFFQRAARVRAELGFAVVGHRLRYVLLPHPSGRCLVWNDLARIADARDLIRSCDRDVWMAVGSEPVE